ncbi:MAG: hypothetical protein HN909_09460, partial [Phycisphaerales bacterium]|nr:hypothetical protein [Phycisphaerales bacterium]
MLRRTQWMVRLVLILGVAIGSVASVSLRGETPAPEASKTELSPSDLWYQDLCAAYLKADWVKFDEQIKIKSKHYYKMDRANRPMALAMQVSAKESRPTWWKNCRSPSPCSFKVRVWQKSFMANFKPSTSLGYQAAAAYDPRTRKLIYLVSWRPAYVDSTDPFDNDKMEEAYGLRIHRAEEYGFTMGNMAELIAWHELGHHCISSTFTIDQIEILYNNHRELYGVLQEFYADMAALYH